MIKTKMIKMKNKIVTMIKIQIKIITEIKILLKIMIIKTTKTMIRMVILIE
jgi:hypothetical protein